MVGGIKNAAKTWRRKVPNKKAAPQVGRRKKKVTEAPTTKAVGAGCQPITLNRIALLMQEMGYRGKVMLSEEWSWVESATNGTNFNVYVFSDEMSDPDSEARTIQFDGGWGGLSSYDAWRFLMVCNRFNHERRFAKVTVGNDKDHYSLSVRLDHHCLNGMTNNQFLMIADTYIRIFDDIATRITTVGDDALSVLIDRHKKANDLMWSAESDPDQALAIYLKNARAGYAGSMNSLGEIYENGFDAAQSVPISAYFYARAAERGQPSAYYGLARVLAKDAKDEEIIVEAAKFAVLACRDLPDGQNKTGAKMLRDQLLEKLSSDARDMAVKLAGAWLPLALEGGPIDAEPVFDYGRSSSSSTLN
jgi:hypothetical protein